MGIHRHKQFSPGDRAVLVHGPGCSAQVVTVRGTCLADAFVCGRAESANVIASSYFVEPEQAMSVLGTKLFSVTGADPRDFVSAWLCGLWQSGCDGSDLREGQVAQLTFGDRVLATLSFVTDSACGSMRMRVACDEYIGDVPYHGSLPVAAHELASQCRSFVAKHN